MSAKVQPQDEVSILYFVENGVQCWTLGLDEAETFERRGYSYTIVKYVRKEEQHDT